MSQDFDTDGNGIIWRGTQKTVQSAQIELLIFQDQAAKVCLGEYLCDTVHH